MPPASRAFSSTGLAGPVAFGAGLLLLAFAPIIRGGNRHVAMAPLEWLGLLILLLLAVQWAGATRAPGRGTAPRPVANPAASAAVLVLGLAPLWTALVQLTPLPASLWAALPGRELYVQALAVAQAPAAAFRPLSLVPDATWVSVLAGIPLTAVFLLAHTCTPRQLTVLARALVVFALAQAVLGLLQKGPFSGLSFDALYGAGKAIGSFANPNHFANYINMSVPLAILLLRQGSGSARARGSSDGSRLPVGALWGVALFILLAAVLASNSRAGAITGLVVTVLAVLLLPLRRSHAPARHWRMAGVAALLLLVAAAVGVDALMSRFTDKSGYGDSDRWMMVTSTWRAALTFWPVGSGLGSFAAVYPGFQPAGLQGLVNHAHNDYVQLLMECGLLAGVLAGVAVALVARQAARLVRRARAVGLDAPALLQASCGLGLLAVLLHSWVDFNLRIPANALSAAFLLGAFLRPLASRAPDHRPDDGA